MKRFLSLFVAITAFLFLTAGTSVPPSPRLGSVQNLKVNKTLKLTQGTDVASAGALTLGDGNFFDITGTTTINTITTKGIGTTVTLQFDGILILTHSADLFLPTAANITTAAGDIAMFYEYAAGDWRCENYERADGTALAGSGAPAAATYITQTAHGSLSAEQAMGALGTGSVWSTTTTGVQSISAGLTSLGGLTETNGGIPYGTADDAYSWLGAGAEGTLLMGNGAGAPSFLAAGTAGYFLLGNGAADPVWTTQPTLTSLEGLTFTNGDIIYASGADTLVVLDHGPAGYLLQANGAAAPTWAVASSALPMNYITGLVLSNDTDADNDINITAGECRDSTDVVDIILATEITKRIDAAWSVGNDAGGLDTGAVAVATIYSVWLIKRSDTGVVDALFSLSMTAPTMPANYDFKRFIGYVWTLDGAATIKAFTMTESGEIWFALASQCIVVTGAKTSYTTYGENPIDLSGDLPTGHYDSVLFGAQAATTATALQLSSDGTNTIKTGGGYFGATIADGGQNAWSDNLNAANAFSFIPLKVADTVYMIASTQDANNVSLLIHAVKLKYR